MARIAFLPLSESGHINATFKLARQLRAYGHEVRYLALPDVESHIRSQGWDFIPIFEHLFPKGFVDGVQTLLVSDAPRREKRAAALELRRRMAAQGSEVLFNADFEARLREHELLLVDSTYTQPALTARRVGIPTAILSTTLPLRQDMAIPAMFFRSIPTGSWWSRFKIRAFWNFFNGGIALFGGSPVQKQLREFSRQYPELEGLYELVVERLGDGEVSPFFHDVAEAGDTIEIRGPFGGHFAWAPEDGGPLLLVGGGSGVAPLLSILRHRAAVGSEVPAVLLYAARTWDDVIYREELLARDLAEAGFTLLLSLSRDTARRLQDAGRRVDAPLLRDALARLGAAPRLTFACGSNPFVEAVTGHLLDLGLAPKSIRTERFGG